jgi:hypothetical protein
VRDDEEQDGYEREKQKKLDGIKLHVMHPNPAPVPRQNASFF